MNDNDVISRMQIEELLLKFKSTVRFVERDKAFCENIATKIVRLQMKESPSRGSGGGFCGFA